MVKYLGPKLKKLKRLNLSFMPGFSTKFYYKKCFFKYYNVSSFSLNLLEKQKLKFLLNLKENKIKFYMQLIKRYKNINLTLLINLRLETYLYNLGLVKTLFEARQLINHGHILINYKINKKPSYLMNMKDILSLNIKNRSVFTKCKINFIEKYHSNNMFLKNNNICLQFFKFRIYNFNLIANFI